MKPVMDCREARAHAPLFVGEDLESDALEAVRVHLSGCAECAAQVASLERALRAFEVERVRVDPRVDLWSDIERELAHSGHLRPAQTAAQSLVASSVGPVAVSSKTATAALATPSLATPQQATDATPVPVLARRTLAGARRWFAVAAAAAVAAFAFDAWSSRETEHLDSPNGAQLGPGPTGPQFVRSSEPTIVAPLGSVAGEARPSVDAPVSLVADVPQPSNAPAPARLEGLRRVNGDEALLRESLGRWGVQGEPGGYSLVGYPVTR